MPSTTPLGYPIPLGSDPVAQGDDAIRALAQMINDRLGISSGGEVTIAATAGSGAADVNFPEPFTALPLITMSSNGDGWTCWWNNRTLSGFRVNLEHTSGTGSQSVTVTWKATQL